MRCFKSLHQFNQQRSFLFMFTVEKREKQRGAFIEKEPLDDEKGAVTSAG